MLLKEFRKEARPAIAAILWKHWTALGVASNAEPESKWFIDLEALLLPTLLLGGAEKRLLGLAAEWVRENAEWLNLSRLKRAGRLYSKQDDSLKRAIIPRSALQQFFAALKPHTENLPLRVSEGAPESFESIDDFISFLDKKGTKRKTVTPNLRNPVLCQLQLRGLFGINARAEVCLYLCNRSGGSSNHIAGEIGFDQKIVYRILEKWVESGIVQKDERRSYVITVKGRNMALCHDREGLQYVNWVSAFHLLSRIYCALETQPWAEDEYMMSSFFRDIAAETQTLGRELGLPIPEPADYSGETYFNPFGKALLAILETEL